MDITTLLLLTVPFLFAKKKADSTPGNNVPTVTGPFSLQSDNTIVANIKGTDWIIDWPNKMQDMRKIVDFLNYYFRENLSEQYAALTPQVENSPAGWEANPLDRFNLNNADNLAAANVLMAVHNVAPMFPARINVFADNYWYKRNNMRLQFFELPNVLVKKSYKPNTNAPKIFVLEPSSPYRFKDAVVYYHTPFVITQALLDVLNDFLSKKNFADFNNLVNARPFTNQEQAMINLAAEKNGFNFFFPNGKAIVPSWQAISRPLANLVQSGTGVSPSPSTPGTSVSSSPSTRGTSVSPSPSTPDTFAPRVIGNYRKNPNYVNYF